MWVKSNVLVLGYKGWRIGEMIGDINAKPVLSNLGAIRELLTGTQRGDGFKVALRKRARVIE